MSEVLIHLPRTHYQTLGVSENASPEEIKKARTKALRRVHPDLNSDNGAHGKAKSINLAYETIGDPQKKQAYDAQELPALKTRRDALAKKLWHERKRNKENKINAQEQQEIEKRNQERKEKKWQEEQHKKKEEAAAIAQAKKLREIELAKHTSAGYEFGERLSEWIYEPNHIEQAIQDRQLLLDAAKKLGGYLAIDMPKVMLIKQLNF